LNRPGRLLICARLLLALPGNLCLAQYYYDMEPSSIADADREALIEALDEFDPLKGLAESIQLQRIGRSGSTECRRVKPPGRCLSEGTVGMPGKRELPASGG